MSGRKRPAASIAALALLLALVQPAGAAVAADPAGAAAAPASVRVHGSIRDTGGNPRRADVLVSTFLGPVLAQGQSGADGSYGFDLPVQENYVVQVFPPPGAIAAAITFPAGFLDTWQRVDRGTRTDLAVDVVVQPAGILFLDAYDPQGNRMYNDQFPDPEAFALYPLGTMPVHRSVELQNRQRPLFWGWETVAGKLRHPAMLLLPSQAGGKFTLWGLWRVPEAGTIMLEMDNGGQGFFAATGQVVTANVPYEFARTELRKAREKYDQRAAAGYVFSAAIPGWLAEAEAGVDAARGHLQVGDRARAAATAYHALSVALRAKEAVAMEVARQDIERYRRVPVAVTVLGPDQQTLSGIRVGYRQINHDFLLSGTWGGDTAIVGETGETARRVGNYSTYMNIARDIGFEWLNYPPQPGWDRVQRGWPSVPFIFDDDVLVRKLRDYGLRATGNAIWLAGSPFFAYPRRLDGLGYDEVKAAAVNYIATTLSHYGDRIQWWNLMNEPNLANALNFTPEQMLEFTKAVLTAGRATDQQAVMAVLLTAPGLEKWGYMVETPGYQSAAAFTPTYDYLRQMRNSGVRPDAVGVQFYHGVYLPAIDLGSASDLLDLYGRDFDIPLYIEELEYPTHEEYPGIANASTNWGWHEGHTDKAQADWAVSIYTLAFSKRHVVGANWSSGSELPTFLEPMGRQGDGYLRRDGLTPRPMAYALRDLFRSWTTTGDGHTDVEGRLGFTGFAGEYLVTLTGPDGAVRQEKIHVREGQANGFTLAFDQDQSLAENRQAADAALAKVKRSLEWADALGKSKGVAEARDAQAQAQAAYDAGEYWKAAGLGDQATQALNFRIDGEPDDWEGVRPLYTQPDEEAQARGTQLRRFWGAMDDSDLYLLLEFDTSAPRRDVLLELDTGAGRGRGYHLHTVPMGASTILVPQSESAPELALRNRIPTIDAIYGSAVEVRIPLADLGNPTEVKVVDYLEEQAPGSFTSPIRTVGVLTRP